MAGQKRRAEIQKWRGENPERGDRYDVARRKVKSSFLFYGTSDAYPLCAKGLKVKGVNSLQTDQLFAERFTEIVGSRGRVGCIIPTAIATGAGGQYLFRDFTDRSGVASLFDFQNRKPIFRAVDSSQKFCLLTLAGRAVTEPQAQFAFSLHDPTELDDPARIFTLTADEISLLCPNTKTLPIFRTRRDADITLAIHRRIPVLWNETMPGGNPSNIRVKNFFNMTDDEDLFRSRDRLEREGWKSHGNIFTRDGKHMLPLYEGKMVSHFDHRWNSFFGMGDEDRRPLTLAEKQNPAVGAEPRYWIAEDGLIPTSRHDRNVEIPGVSLSLNKLGWEHEWLCGWRDVTKGINERTAISAFLPPFGVGHTFPLMFPGVPTVHVAALIAAQSSFVFDFVSRQKCRDKHMELYTWKQLPVPAPSALEPHTGFITPRVLELAYTAYDMSPLAQDLGDDGAPFTWDEERRSRLRVELDAFLFRMYGIEREVADYIMETFPIVKEKDIAKHGTYRTKDLILDAYDRMAAAEAAGEPYESPLSPPPCQGPRHPAAT
jgi:hypothetical protein